MFQVECPFILIHPPVGLIDQLFHRAPLPESLRLEDNVEIAFEDILTVLPLIAQSM